MHDFAFSLCSKRRVQLEEIAVDGLKSLTSSRVQNPAVSEYANLCVAKRPADLFLPRRITLTNHFERKVKFTGKVKL